MTKKAPPILVAETAKSILAGNYRVSLDLGISETTIKQINSTYWLDRVESIDRDDLEKIAQHEGSIYFVENKSVFMAAIGGKHFYKLVKTSGAPTLEIDGIRMHRTKGTSPEKDAMEKLEILGLKSGKVIDTCMGLGYSAIRAYERGAECVVSVEFEPNVVRIAQLNPWSAKLFNEPTIHKVLGDSFNVVDSFPVGCFDYVIHDPPRHDRAGHLYGLNFYRKLSRVIKPGGRLFHYTGEPRARYRHVNLQKGVIDRLRNAGFIDLKYHPGVMGVTCTKGTA